jgi:hypothetical protein
MGTSRQAVTRLLVATALTLGIAGQLAAEQDKRIPHHKAKPSETLEQAVDNFASYNSRLAAIMRKKTLDADDIVAIHEITYTLELALGKINEEFDELAETLEALHVATEKANFEDTRSYGDEYLKTARKVIP